jgi:peptide deformylase
MMEIVLYPDPRLRAKNAPITSFDDELKQLARGMLDLMYETKGVGLAAPQVGVNRRLMVFNAEGDPEKPEFETILCNPRVVRKAKSKVSAEEGCLSFPGIYAQVERPEDIVILAQDVNGDEFEMALDDWAARVFQHEFDHLEGVLFIDRFTPSDKMRLKPVLKGLEFDYKEKIAGT